MEWIYDPRSILNKVLQKLQNNLLKTSALNLFIFRYLHQVKPILLFNVNYTVNGSLLLKKMIMIVYLNIKTLNNDTFITGNLVWFKNHLSGESYSQKQLLNSLRM